VLQCVLQDLFCVIGCVLQCVLQDSMCVARAVECYNQSTNRWTSMPGVSVAVCVAVCVAASACVLQCACLLCLSEGMAHV